MTQLDPLGDKLVIMPSKNADKLTASGIIIAEGLQEKPNDGLVVAVGPGRWSDAGTLSPMYVKAGERILFSKYGGTPFEAGGEEYLILSQDDVLAILRESEEVLEEVAVDSVG